MLFISYFELNENSPFTTNLQGAQKVMAAGLYPPTGVNIIRWDTTPDGWGVLIAEAESAESLFRAINVWRAAIPGFFKSVKTAPAMPIMEAIPLSTQIVQALGGSS